MPGVPLAFSKAGADKQILMVELQPQIDDGKHFVYYNNGQLRREEIDSPAMQNLGFEIRPQVIKQSVAETVSYRLRARLKDPSIRTLIFTLKNGHPAAEMTVTVPVDGPPPPSPTSPTISHLPSPISGSDAAPPRPNLINPKSALD